MHFRKIQVLIIGYGKVKFKCLRFGDINERKDFITLELWYSPLGSIQSAWKDRPSLSDAKDNAPLCEPDATFLMNGMLPLLHIHRNNMVPPMLWSNLPCQGWENGPTWKLLAVQDRGP